MGFIQGSWREVCIKPQIQEGQCGFCPGQETMELLYLLSGVLQGACEFFPSGPGALDCVRQEILSGYSKRIVFQAL